MLNQSHSAAVCKPIYCLLIQIHQVSAKPGTAVVLTSYQYVTVVVLVIVAGVSVVVGGEGSAVVDESFLR